MPRNAQIPEHARRPQFSLRALFVLMTGMSVLLGMGYWIGWLRVSGTLLVGTRLCQVGVTFWPVVIAVLWLNSARAKLYGWCVLVLGILFLLHLTATVFHVGILRSSAMGLDKIACKDLLEGTLNWTVPSVAVGLSVGLYLGLTARSTLAYLVGCFLATVGLVGFFWVAQGLDYTRSGLMDFVWWL